MSNEEQAKIVMLDTSFLIRLLKVDESLHESAKGYFQYFLEHGYTLYVSTVAVAEYCVHGEPDQLPFDNVRITPFNFNHAVKAGHYARTLFEAKINGRYSPEQRLIIPNDTKIFAQAASVGALYFVTADTKSSKAIDLLAKENGFSIVHVDIHRPLSEFTGTLF